MFKKKKELTFKDVKVLQIKDGDTIFLTVKGRVTDDSLRHMKDLVSDMFASRAIKDVKVVILECGMRVKKEVYGR